MKLFGVGQDEEIVELEDKMDNLIENNENIGQLALDILETEDEVIILSPIAGIDLSEIDVSYNNGVLVLQGNRKKPLIFDQNVIVRNNECFWGQFSRNIILPENLNSNTIEATMEHNLLVITIQKIQFGDNNSIKINRTSF